MDAHAQLRAQLNVIHGELAARGIRSAKIDSATYTIETLARAYMEEAVRPESWERFGFTPIQGRIFDVLHQRKGKYVGKDALFDLLWGGDVGGGPNCQSSISVHILALRRKLYGSGLRLETAWGQGYRIVDGEQTARQTANNPHSVKYDGVIMGKRPAKVAEILKASLGQVVSFATFRAAGITSCGLSVHVGVLRAIYRGKFVIEGVNGAGYRMTPAVPTLALTALRDLAA